MSSWCNHLHLYLNICRVFLWLTCCCFSTTKLQFSSFLFRLLGSIHVAWMMRKGGANCYLLYEHEKLRWSDNSDQFGLTGVSVSLRSFSIRYFIDWKFWSFLSLATAVVSEDGSTCLPNSWRVFVRERKSDVPIDTFWDREWTETLSACSFLLHFLLPSWCFRLVVSVREYELGRKRSSQKSCSIAMAGRTGTRLENIIHKHSHNFLRSFIPASASFQFILLPHLIFW